MKKLSFGFITGLVVVMLSFSVSAKAEGFEVEFDILYHKVDSLNYDFVMTEVFSAPVSSIERVEPSFDTGYRLNVRKSGGNGWDYGVTFTSISASESASELDGSGNMGATQLHPANYGLSDPLYIVNARAKADFNYETIDFELGTPVTVSDSVAGRYFIGFRIMDVTNELDITYEDINGYVDRVDKDLDFSGLGISTGFDTKWRLKETITVNAGLSMALVSGEIELNNREFEDGVTVFKTRDIDDIVVNVFDYSLGIIYEIANYKVGLGYEITKVIGLYNTRFSDDALETFSSNADENLSLSGFYLRGVMSF